MQPRVSQPGAVWGARDTSPLVFLWLQDNVSKGELKVVKVGTADQLADFLTKPVTARWLAEEISRAWFGVSWWPFFSAAWIGLLMEVGIYRWLELERMSTCLTCASL